MTSSSGSRPPDESSAGSVDDPPRRVYALEPERVPAPAVYAELASAEAEAAIPVIVHNLRYYEFAMDRWNVGFIELLVLNELHELTHWAMTGDERRELDEQSYPRPDGEWLNPALLEIIEWLPREHPDVIDAEPSFWRRLGASVLDALGGRSSAD